jgi:hypothetical protein
MILQETSGSQYPSSFKLASIFDITREIKVKTSWPNQAVFLFVDAGSPYRKPVKGRAVSFYIFYPLKSCAIRLEIYIQLMVGMSKMFI